MTSPPSALESKCLALEAFLEYRDPTITYAVFEEMKASESEALKTFAEWRTLIRVDEFRRALPHLGQRGREFLVAFFLRLGNSEAMEKRNFYYHSSATLRTLMSTLLALRYPLAVIRYINHWACGSPSPYADHLLLALDYEESDVLAELFATPKMHLLSRERKLITFVPVLGEALGTGRTRHYEMLKRKCLEWLPDLAIARTSDVMSVDRQMEMSIRSTLRAMFPDCVPGQWPTQVVRHVASSASVSIENAQKALDKYDGTVAEAIRYAKAFHGTDGS